jgi:hypothetical protein
LKVGEMTEKVGFVGLAKRLEEEEFSEVHIQKAP